MYSSSNGRSPADIHHGENRASGRSTDALRSHCALTPLVFLLYVFGRFFLFEPTSGAQLSAPRFLVLNGVGPSPPAISVMEQKHP